MRSAIILVLALSQYGCSFIVVRSAERAGARDCVSSSIPPAFDVAEATVGAAGTALLVSLANSLDSSSSSGRSSCCSSEEMAQIATLVGITALYTASAIWGFSQTSRCQALRAQAEPLPASWRP